MCFDGGNVFIGIIASIKLGKGRRFETFRIMGLTYFFREWLGTQKFHLFWVIDILLAMSDVFDVVFQRLIVAS